MLRERYYPNVVLALWHFPMYILELGNLHDALRFLSLVRVVTAEATFFVRLRKKTIMKVHDPSSSYVLFFICDIQRFVPRQSAHHLENFNQISSH